MTVRWYVSGSCAHAWCVSFIVWLKRRRGLPPFPLPPTPTPAHWHVSPQGKFLDVRKNRFDGSLGRVPIEFDSQRQMFVEAAGTRVAGAAPPLWDVARQAYTSTVTVSTGGSSPSPSLTPMSAPPPVTVSLASPLATAPSTDFLALVGTPSFDGVPGAGSGTPPTAAAVRVTSTRKRATASAAAAAELDGVPATGTSFAAKQRSATKRGLKKISPAAAVAAGVVGVVLPVLPKADANAASPPSLSLSPLSSSSSTASTATTETTAAFADALAGLEAEPRPIVHPTVPAATAPPTSVTTVKTVHADSSAASLLEDEVKHWLQELEAAVVLPLPPGGPLSAPGSGPGAGMHMGTGRSGFGPGAGRTPSSPAPTSRVKPIAWEDDIIMS
jgi:hypothetical protein